MGRSIGGAIVGYLVMAVVVMVTLTGAYLVLGANGAFQPGSYAVSSLWLATTFLFDAVAAVTGGMACAAVARGDRRGPIFLVVLMLALGAAVAVGEMSKDRSSLQLVRTADVGNLEAMQKAVQPLWVAYLTPLVGAGGALLGARLRRPRRAA